MEVIFLKVLNMSIAAGWLILGVILVRLLLPHMPKWISCALWGMVAIRLLCPFSLQSPLSLIPSSEPIPADIIASQTTSIHTGITAISTSVNPILSDSFAPEPTASMRPLHIVAAAAAVIWMIGMSALLLYALCSYLHLKKTVAASIPLQDGVMVCDEVKSPFLLGMGKPVIYVPSSMTEPTLTYVIAHETAHIRRHDHWWKPLGYLLLTLYWFHPLCWLAYGLFCRDIEKACDEKVIRNMDRDGMAAYSQALLESSVPRKRVAACPLAFGEIGVKQRVRGILQYQKPPLHRIVAAGLAAVLLAVCLMTDPFPYKRHSVPVKWFDAQDEDEMFWKESQEITLDEFPGVIFRWRCDTMEAVTNEGVTTLYTGMPIWSVYFYDLTGDGKPELCSTLSIGSGIIDDRIIVHDYAKGFNYQLSDRMAYDYRLYLQNDRLYIEKRSYGDNALVASGELIFENNSLHTIPDIISGSDIRRYDAPEQFG